MCEEPDYPVDFEQCLSIMRCGDSLEADCPRCGKSEFLSHRFFKSTPKYLLLVPNRFVIKNFMERKLNAIIAMPEHLNIGSFLLKNSPASGDLLQEEKKKKYDEASLATLMDMGQDRNASIRALIENNGNVEAALNWIFENTDKDLSAPLPEQNEAAVAVDAQAVAQVMEMGFEETQAKVALIKNVLRPLSSNPTSPMPSSGCLTAEAMCRLSWTCSSQQRILSRVRRLALSKMTTA